MSYVIKEVSKLETSYGMSGRAVGSNDCDGDTEKETWEP